jgi:hypothetical protein
MNVKTYREWCDEEGFLWPPERSGEDEKKLAEEGYAEYCKGQNVKCEIEVPPPVISTGRRNLEDASSDAGKTEEGKKMARVKGTCFGCGRPDLKINAKEEGLCGSCQIAVKGTVKGSPERAVILEAQAQKWAGRGKQHRGGKKTEKPPKEKKTRVKKEGKKKVAAEDRQSPASGEVIPQPKPLSDLSIKVHVDTSEADKFIGRVEEVLGKVRSAANFRAEAGIQFFISRNSGLHIGLKCHLSRRIWNLVSVRIGGSHANL